MASLTPATTSRLKCATYRKASGLTEATSRKTFVVAEEARHPISNRPRRSRREYELRRMGDTTGPCPKRRHYSRSRWMTTTGYLQYVALRDPLVYSVLAGSYTLFLFSTPFFIYSAAFSGIYVLSFARKRKQKRNPLPLYPDPKFRDDLFLVVGEIHHPTKITPASDPQWLTIPEKGLFTGIGVFGAVGTGKTTCCMRPFAEQLIAFKADEPAKRIGGLVLEVKGDFCHQIREIARQHAREDDYVEIALNSDYRYNPLHNDLDSSALAYSVASLLNNLYGHGKEPFWQQAYTNICRVGLNRWEFLQKFTRSVR